MNLTTVKFWIDEAPNLIGIAVLAVVGWHKIRHLNNMAEIHGDHLAAHDNMNTAQNRHLRVHDKMLGILPTTATVIPPQDFENKDER